MRWLDWFTHVCACWKHTVPGVRLKLHALAREPVRGETSPFFLRLRSSVASPIFSLQPTAPLVLPLSSAPPVHFLSFSLSLLRPSSTLAPRPSRRLPELVLGRRDGARGD